VVGSKLLIARLVMASERKLVSERKLCRVVGLLLTFGFMLLTPHLTLCSPSPNVRLVDGRKAGCNESSEAQRCSIDLSTRTSIWASDDSLQLVATLWF
jgi:hypothetical protein